MTPDELLRINKELREAIRLRDEFLAVAAHELRNPMHALSLQVAAALRAARKGGHEDLIARLERVELVLDRYLKRATALLDLSRLNSDGPALHISDVDAAEVVRDVVESYELEAAFHGATLKASIPDRCDGRWDRMALEQIISNLVSNAIRYGDGKPVRISLVRQHDMLGIEVRDEGIGISSDDQARIFGRFEQVRIPQATGGFGIGLWVVRSLVDAHHGSISVDSAPGEGTTFTVRLPLDAGTTDLDHI